MWVLGARDRQFDKGSNGLGIQDLGFGLGTKVWILQIIWSVRKDPVSISAQITPAVTTFMRMVSLHSRQRF